MNFSDNYISPKIFDTSIGYPMTETEVESSLKIGKALKTRNYTHELLHHLSVQRGVNDRFYAEFPSRLFPGLHIDDLHILLMEQLLK